MAMCLNIYADYMNLFWHLNTLTYKYLSTNTGWSEDELKQPRDEGFGSAAGGEAGCSPENQLCRWLHQNQCGQQVEGGDSVPLL